jgi:WD40 repeat protein
MKLTFGMSLSGWIALAFAGPLAAQQPPSYARDVKPFFARYCLECHAGDKPKGDLSLETYKGLTEGGKSGSVMVPGKAEESRLVLLVEGKDKPPMPPKTAKQPKPTEVAVLRAWVAAGAKDDGAGLIVTLPDIKPRVAVAAPVSALAFRPDGKVVAGGGHKEVLLLDVASGDLLGRLSGQAGAITALVFSRDGKKLAAASSAPGRAGELRLYGVQASGLPKDGPDVMVPAHQDVILDLAWSPDGSILATCSYDRLVKLWDGGTGKELRTLKDHSDAVYGVSFSPDGRWLASGGADRAVKVWEVASGRRLYTLGEATDWIYSVAWSPSGRHLAGAGVDKSIRIWEVGPTGGRIIHSVFAHEGPVNRLVYSTDGKTLYSLSEDRSFKAWDAERMVERKVYSRLPETPLALAVRPDHQQLAVGRYDGWLGLVDDATGQVQAELLPYKPRPPVVAKHSPTFGTRGQTHRLTFEGRNLEAVTEVQVSVPGATAKLVGGKSVTQIQADVVLPPITPAGVYQVVLQSAAGKSAPVSFTVDLFPTVTEKEPNDTLATGQPVSLPVTVVGKLGRAGDVDYYRFEAQAGQQVGVQVMTAGKDSKLDAMLQLMEAGGAVLVESTSGLLGHTCARAGVYVLSIRDRDYRGGAQMAYRLHMGDIPIVTAVYPLGVQRGSEATIHVEGVNLGTLIAVQLKAPTNAELGSRIPVSFTTPKGAPLGNPSVVVGELPEVVHSPAPAGGAGHPVMPVPATANGRIERPSATDTWRFAAKKGQRLIVEVNARRIGSPLDSYIEILDGQGHPVPRATLRCLAKTYTTFRDHDSSGSGIRLEAWSELAMNDYLLVGDELIRIRELPRNPDDDCQFFSAGGQRLGFLDTTPTFHSLGSPMYKVAIHLPGTSFPPNGLPVITVYYRNDDGGPGYGKDSRLFFDPPADGEYLVRIGDSRGQGGSEYAYRLTVRPPRPSFNVRFDPTAPTVGKGSAVPITVSADRTDGFQGPIEIRLENIPSGFRAPATSIPAEENNTAFALWAEPTAATPAKAPPLRLIARAVIDGKEVIREVNGGLPQAADPGDIVTTTQQAEVTVKPGGQVAVTAAIERRNGFAGRVPLEVKGLPHGVHVLDVGLNGILITEKETRRSFVIYAEPWVEPMQHPFVVLARREGKNTEHAAPSVLLKVAPK